MGARILPLASWVRRVEKYLAEGIGELKFVSIEVDDQGAESYEDADLDDIKARTPGTFAAVDATTQEVVAVCQIDSSGNRILQSRRGSHGGMNMMTPEATVSRALTSLSLQWGDFATAQAQALKVKDARIAQLEAMNDALKDKLAEAILEQEDGPEAELIGVASQLAGQWMSRGDQTKFRDAAMHIVVKAKQKGIITQEQIDALEPIINEELQQIVSDPLFSSKRLDA